MRSRCCRRSRGPEVSKPRAVSSGSPQQAISARLKSIESQAACGWSPAPRTVRASTPSGTVVAGWANQVLDVARLLDAGLASLREAARADQDRGESDRRRAIASRWLVSTQVAAQRRGAVAPRSLSARLTAIRRSSRCATARPTWASSKHRVRCVVCAVEWSVDGSSWWFLQSTNGHGGRRR